MSHDCCNIPACCAQCDQASKTELYYRQLPQGYHFPAEKSTQNFMLFMLEGELLFNSEEYPGTTLHAGQCILQAIGSKMEALTLSKARYLVYYFTELPLLCEDYYRQILQEVATPLTYTPLAISSRLGRVIADITEHMQEHSKPCDRYLNMKCSELVFVLTNHYPQPQVSAFFYPISTYTESFHYFVMQNYHRVKNVEEFAHLGGYSLATFRRLFKNVYGSPVYEWILDKKREGILDDLKHTNKRISVISASYGFDNLSHFAHFCQNSFGDTPRSLRKRLAAGEVITILKYQADSQAKQTADADPSGEE